MPSAPLPTGPFHLLFFLFRLCLRVTTVGLIHFCQNQVIIISIRDAIVHFVGDPADVDGVVDILLDDY